MQRLPCSPLCYIDLASVTSALNFGSLFLLNLPSNLIKFSLNGCAVPSKTKLTSQPVQRPMSSHRLMQALRKLLPCPKLYHPREIPTKTSTSLKCKKYSPFSLANLGSLNRFFGNMPLTARFSTSPPPHFFIMVSMLIAFRAPGRVVCL